MYNFTVMRQQTPEEGSGWEVWEVFANDIQEAVEDCADIPGVYVVFTGEGTHVNVVSETRFVARNHTNT